MLRDIKVEYEEPITIFYDNSSAKNISKNPVLHSKTKHISIKFDFLREQVNKDEVRLEFVPSKDQIEDIFTKPLPKDSFKYLREKLGVIAPPVMNRDALMCISPVDIIVISCDPDW